MSLLVGYLFCVRYSSLSPDAGSGLFDAQHQVRIIFQYHLFLFSAYPSYFKSQRLYHPNRLIPCDKESGFMCYSGSPFAVEERLAYAFVAFWEDHFVEIVHAAFNGMVLVHFFPGFVAFLMVGLIGVFDVRFLSEEIPDELKQLFFQIGAVAVYSMGEIYSVSFHSFLL